MAGARDEASLLDCLVNRAQVAACQVGIEVVKACWDMSNEEREEAQKAGRWHAASLAQDGWRR